MLHLKKTVFQSILQTKSTLSCHCHTIKTSNGGPSSFQSSSSFSLCPIFDYHPLAIDWVTFPAPVFDHVFTTKYASGFPYGFSCIFFPTNSSPTRLSSVQPHRRSPWPWEPQMETWGQDLPSLPLPIFMVTWETWPWNTMDHWENHLEMAWIPNKEIIHTMRQSTGIMTGWDYASTF